uniref:TIP41-like protein n=1 Tax=Physcomitrium patens TaxID=3218 RepID=A0A7I4A2Z2_PHYPA
MACDDCACGNVAKELDQATLRTDCLDDEETLRLKALKATGGELIQGDGVKGIRVGGWFIQSRKGPILKMGPREKWEKMLGTIHLPQMVFGDNSLELVHETSGVKIHFNALDALRGWRQESLPPVKIPAAAKWKLRTKPDEQIILNYDYTYTTPYAGSQFVQEKQGDVNTAVEWVESQERIDMAALQARDPILFFEEVVLYEDELDDNGISLLTAKVRVMPSCWFLLLRFWMRVDGALIRLRDTRMYCRIQRDSTALPVVIRERNIKEDTFDALVSVIHVIQLCIMTQL